MINPFATDAAVCGVITPAVNLQDGLRLLADLHPLLLKLEIGIGLTGSLAYRGTSTKDIDLVLYPFHEKRTLTIDWLRAFLTPLGFTIDYAGSSTGSGSDPNTVLVTTYNGKRVDFLLTSR